MAAFSWMACSRTDANVSDANAAVDSGSAGGAAVQAAQEIADDLELAHERAFVCRDLLPDTSLWKASDRECFVALMAMHLERRDGLSTCVREAARALSQCGQALPCSSALCANAIFFDDTAIEEFVSENCGQFRAAASPGLIACRTVPSGG